MKNPIPACAKCNTNKFVVRDRSMEKVGTVAGGTLGAGTALAGLGSGTAAGAAIGSCIPILGTAAGAGIGALTGRERNRQRGWRTDRCQNPYEIPLHELRQ